MESAGLKFAVFVDSSYDTSCGFDSRIKWSLSDYGQMEGNPLIFFVFFNIIVIIIIIIIIILLLSSFSRTIENGLYLSLRHLQSQRRIPHRCLFAWVMSCSVHKPNTK